MAGGRRWALALAIMAAALLAAAALLWLLRPPVVPVVEVGRGPAVEVVYATGFVEPENPVSVASRVTAPIAEVLVREGERVSQGQPLARLDRAEQRSLVAQLSAETRNARLEEERTVQLFERGFAARAARDRVVAARRVAEAAEQAARARLDQYVVRAGIDGIVLRRDAEPGDLATPNNMLFLLGDPDDLRITATVDERDIPRVRPGQMVLMSTAAFPDRILRGMVREITPGGDPDQRAFRVRIEPVEGFDAPIGLTLEINIVTARKDAALLVPAGAVRNGGLWVVENGRATYRPVKTGVESEERVEILSGIAAGEQVILDPPAAIAEGARVRAREARR